MSLPVSTSHNVSVGFAPLAVSEDDLPEESVRLAECSSEDDIDASGANSETSEKSSSDSAHDSDSTEHYCVSGFMTLSVGNANICGVALASVPIITQASETVPTTASSPLKLQKMNLMDFKTKHAHLVSEKSMASIAGNEAYVNVNENGSKPASSTNIEGLPPIPPTLPVSTVTNPVPKVATQSVRTQAGSSRLKSPSRQSYRQRQQKDESKCLRSHSEMREQERRLSSPSSDLSTVFPSYAEYHDDSRNRTQKPYKIKYLAGRASLERDVAPAVSNRHSSYHPRIPDDVTTAAAIAMANKINKLYLNRPQSPRSRRACSCERGCYCSGSKTLPIRNSGLGFQCSTHERTCNYGSRGSLVGLELEDRLLRLESDKDALHIEVSVLSDQIDVQTSKIRDLEKVLDDKKNVLETTQDTLSMELLTRSSLETQKLELLTEISSLRLKQAALERENFDLRDRFGGTEYEQRLWSKPPLAPVVGHLRSLSPTLNHQNGFGESSHRSRSGNASSDMTNMPIKPLSRPRTPPANAYRRVDQTSFGTLPRRNHPSQMSAFNNGVSLADTVPSPQRGTSLSSGNLQHHLKLHSDGSFSSPQHAPPMTFQLHLRPFTPHQEGADEVAYATCASGATGFYSAAQSGSRSTSAPNLAVIERDEFESRRLNSGDKTTPTAHKSRGILRILSRLKRSNSGGLDNDVVPEAGVFTRGGFRSTAAPRLGWLSDPFVMKRPTGPVYLWDSDSVILWLSYMGLGMYSNEIKRWVKSGQQLLDASSKELEKELGMKNPLHKKKLSLAINSLKNPNEEDHGGKLDYHWVIRWLDDIGLPQYKETFGDARVDGRVLSHLTVSDLIFLKVTSLLHHVSIKRGIHLLRIHNFHPGCLCRRGIVGMSKGTETPTADHVATWSNHRVMEWLRAVELSEYAPNLRGSGVHGALLILEPKFNSELLATLLSIPADKTLLRRHVNQEVKHLVSRQVMHEKRKLEMTPDFTPLTPTVKVKVVKPMKVFNLRKKRNSIGNEEILCAMDWNYFPFSTSIKRFETSGSGDECHSPTNTGTTNGDRADAV